MLLGLGFWWAVRVGGKMNKLKQMEKGQKVAKNISEYNRQVDQDTQKKIALNRGNPVRGPWLRKRD
jgi:hypothetical protein